jgi:hypothetical protein
MKQQIETYRVIEMVAVFIVALLLLGLMSPRNQNKSCYPQTTDQTNIDLSAINR